MLKGAALRSFRHDLQGDHQSVHKSEETVGPDMQFYDDPYVEFNYLDGLRQSKTPVQYQEGTEMNVTIVIQSITRLPYVQRTRWS